jgi:hypothetical protein
VTLCLYAGRVKLLAWDGRLGGAFWHMNAGDRMQVWIVNISGTRLFIAAATSVHSGPLNKEIQQIVESIRFG